MRDYAKVGGRKTKSPKGTGKPAYRTPSSFRNKVLSVVRTIPKGKTMTYGQVALAAGNAKAARAVGAILKTNQNKAIPCHRVICADGEIGGYNGLKGSKRKILEKEKALQKSNMIKQ